MNLRSTGGHGCTPPKAYLVMTTSSLAQLAQIVGQGEKLVFALGGSSTTERRSRTSDTDLFAIAHRDVLPRLASIASSFPRADLEARDLEWLDGFCALLASYQPSINAGPSPFNFMDLRFLARILLGTIVVSQGTLRDDLETYREPLRVALATYMSSYYVGTFEDVAGLYLDGRYEDALLISGELAQRACLLALLQIALVDPAPKWSFAIARGGGVPELKRAAASMSRHLRTFGTQSPDIWVQNLLRLANGLVATGILEGLNEHESLDVSRICPLTLNAGLCVMGVPGYLTLLDVSKNTISVCNRALLHAFSRQLYAEQHA